MGHTSLWDHIDPPTPTGVFVAERLKQARAFRGLTLAQLADQVGVSFGLISHYEKGHRAPSQAITEALAQVLGFKPTFFYMPLSDVWRENECSFRHRRSTPDAVKRRARAHGTLVTLIVEHLQRVLDFPVYNVPELSVSSTAEMEKAAERCRVHWGLGLDTPILEMGRVLENAGVLLVQHLAHSDKIDAFCRRGRLISVVVINTARQSASRWTFDMAHELGHLVMHTGVETGSVDTELQANRFAGAFGLPRRAFSREFGSSRFSWPHILDLKARWKWSASAIIRRARQLDLIDAVTYQQSYKYMSSHGWLKNEPNEWEFRGPELLPQAFRSLEDGAGESIESVCEALQMERSTLVELTGIKPVVATRQPGPRLVTA